MNRVMLNSLLGFGLFFECISNSLNFNTGYQELDNICYEYCNKFADISIAKKIFRNDFNNLWRDGLSVTNSFQNVMENFQKLTNLRQGFEGKSQELEEQDLLYIALKKAESVHEYSETFMQLFESTDDKLQIDLENNDLENVKTLNARIVKFLQNHNWMSINFEGQKHSVLTEAVLILDDIPMFFKMVQSAENEWLDAVKNLANVEVKWQFAEIFMQEADSYIDSFKKSLLDLGFVYKDENHVQRLSEKRDALSSKLLSEHYMQSTCSKCVKLEK